MVNSNTFLYILAGKAENYIFFFMILCIWAFQFRELSTVTPSSFSLVEIWIGDEFIIWCTFAWIIDCFWAEEINMAFVFCSCIDILFLEPHFTVLLPSAYRSFVMLTGEIPLLVKVASSAKKSITDFSISIAKSLMYIMKSRGRKTDPGAHQMICVGHLKVCLKLRLVDNIVLDMKKTILRYFNWICNALV